MNLRAWTLALALALLALFSLLNWSAFAAPTTLTLGFTEVSAPLGLVMLVVTAIISGLFFLYIVFQQAGVIVDARRTAKELTRQRELADVAEASRFTELKSFLGDGLRGIEARGAATHHELLAHVAQVEQGLREDLAESTRTVSAYLGEIEEKLDRVLANSRS